MISIDPSRTGPSRIRRRLLGGAVLLACLPFVFVLVLRWVPPHRSALMLQQEFSSRDRTTDFDLRYEWVDFSEISPYAAVAVIASEDQKFLDHHGFDSEAISQALRERERGRVRGASTISQQLSKNLFLWPGRNLLRKGLEAGWTVVVELLWPKRRIVEVYLNIVELGDGIFGVEAASQEYFGKSASRLTAEEAALLAAVLPSPRRFRVDQPSEYVRERQQWIFGQMEQLGGLRLVEKLE